MSVGEWLVARGWVGALDGVETFERGGAKGGVVRGG